VLPPAALPRYVDLSVLDRAGNKTGFLEKVFRFFKGFLRFLKVFGF